MNPLIQKACYKIGQQSPKILLGLGLTGMVATTVVACKATPKAADILAEHRKHIDEVHEVTDLIEKGEIPKEKYDEKALRKEVTSLYIQTGIKYAKLYAPAVILGTASILSILTSFKIINGRYVVASAAVAAINGKFDKYREGVVARYGKEADNDIYYGYEEKTVTELDENGKKIKEKKKVRVPQNGCARFFIWEPGDPYFEDGLSPDINERILRNKIRDCGFKMQNHIAGIITENDILEIFGRDPEKDGKDSGFCNNIPMKERNNGLDNPYNPDTQYEQWDEFRSRHNWIEVESHLYEEKPYAIVSIFPDGRIDDLWK